jgi:hypothetical protein
MNPLSDAQVDASESGDGASEPGPVQFCAYNSGCLEFRMHRPSCASGNETNCKTIGGVYGEGSCTASEYTMMAEEQTSCGLTVVFGR